jgi:protein arginine kinase activator
MGDNMQCQCCKNNTATIHLTEITDGQRIEMHLCELCAQKQGLTVKTQIPLNELLSTLLSAQAQPESASAEAEKRVCPHCGITLREFRKKSLLGCPADYDVFEEYIRPLIQSSHEGGTAHCGKIPSRTPSQTKKQTELLALRRELQAAVREEKYEAAAKLRDKISKMLEAEKESKK